jgi:hypothetical protein
LGILYIFEAFFGSAEQGLQAQRVVFEPFGVFGAVLAIATLL